MKSVPSRPKTRRPPKCSGESSDGAWWKMTWTFSTFGAAPSTNRPRATAVLFIMFCPGLGVAPVDQLILRERGIERDVEQAALAARVHRRAGRPPAPTAACRRRSPRAAGPASR